MRDHRRKDRDRTGGTVALEPAAPHGGVTPLPYGDPPALTAFEATFDKDCQAILNKLDEYNTDYRDPDIRRVRATALAQLEAKRAEHRSDDIYRIRKAWDSDLIRCLERLEENERELRENEEELARMEALLAARRGGPAPRGPRSPGKSGPILAPLFRDDGKGA